MESVLESKINANKFSLWIGIVSIVMMFAALTSAYFVRYSAGNWLEFRLPNAFYFSTIVVVLSSLSAEFARRNLLVLKYVNYKKLLLISFLLGIVFCISQLYGWSNLYHLGIDINGNPAGSFFYVISGLHLLHIFAGLMILAVCIFFANFENLEFDNIRINKISMSIFFWHFVDILWLYLFSFLVIFR